jgi:hypothetical protein
MKGRQNTKKVLPQRVGIARFKYMQNMQVVVLGSVCTTLLQELEPQPVSFRNLGVARQGSETNPFEGKSALHRHNQLVSTTQDITCVST